MNKWFSASLFLEATHDLASVPPTLWEERIVLIQAQDESQAMLQAERIGRDAEHSYTVAEPEPHTLHWRFRKIESVYEILSESIEPGIEVFSRLVSAERAKVILGNAESAAD